MSEARTLLVAFWMANTNSDMSARYGKQLIDKVAWRRDCAIKAGVGFEREDASETIQVVSRLRLPSSPQFVILPETEAMPSGEAIVV